MENKLCLSSRWIFLLAFALILSLSLNAAMYQRNRMHVQYFLQGSYQAGNEPETMQLVIDSKSSFSIYYGDGEFPIVGKIKPSSENNYYTMLTESGQTFGLFLQEKRAYVFDGKDWTCFYRYSTAVRVFS